MISAARLPFTKKKQNQARFGMLVSGMNLSRSMPIADQPAFWSKASKEHRWEAEEAARSMLAEMTAQGGPARPAKPVVVPPEPAPFPVESSPEPQLRTAVADTPFIRYLLDFWTPESAYAKYKSGVKKRPLSGYYISMNHDDVKRHVDPFPGFAGVTLGEVSRKHLKDWLIGMSSRKVQWRRKDGTIVEGNQISGRRINTVLQGMRVAVRWAVDNQELAVDPFRKLDEAAEESKEKGILTPVELRKLINLPVSDPFSRLVVLLAARCGMRQGLRRVSGSTAFYSRSWSILKGKAISLRSAIGGICLMGSYIRKRLRGFIVSGVWYPPRMTWR